MIDLTPTRSVVLDLREEQRAMHQGHTFLDEKCLLLAGEIVRELDQYATLARRVQGAAAAASHALKAAIARHGLEGLQLYPAGDMSRSRLERRERGLMGVRLIEATLSVNASPGVQPADPSPEAERCRLACVDLAERAAELAAVAGNLERLSIEYHRSLRRARAIADVILPDLARVTHELETRIEELEQEDAIFMAQAGRRSGSTIA